MSFPNDISPAHPTDATTSPTTTITQLIHFTIESSNRRKPDPRLYRPFPAFHSSNDGSRARQAIADT
jgi:hypothetical protein